MKRNQVKEAKFSQSNNLEKAVPYIIEWYQNNKRDLPWRNGANAYHIWVSEIMLQQTRVEAVKSYYAAFLEAFPTIEALANAPEERLLKLWEGLGYYNRVRNMQKAAVQIVELYNGQMPQDYERIVRDWKLYGRGYQFICIWDSETGGGWECLACYFKISCKL